MEMKKLFALLLFIFLLMPITLAFKDRFGRERLIILLEKRATKRQLNELTSVGFKLTHKYKIINAVAGTLPREKLKLLRKTRGIRVYRDLKVHALLDESVPLVEADKLHAKGVNGSGIRVCVVDTGVDDGHPALNQLIAEWDFVNQDDDASDDNGHGTHIAGIIASTDELYTGVAPGVSLMAAKVLDAYGSGYESDVIAGIEWCVENGANVISLSLGAIYYGNCDKEPLGEAVNRASEGGVVVVAAAGNNGRRVELPACASGSIAVGAVDKDKNVPYWSSRGHELDLVAPGVDITSTKVGGGWKWMSGTSMAAPHVSGVAALLLQAKPSLTPEAIRNVLKNTTSQVNECYTCRFLRGGSCLFGMRKVPCTKLITGAGIVNAYEAYKLLGCTSDEDCDDGNECTLDACIDNSCKYTVLADNTACSSGVCCSGACIRPTCSVAAECDDENTCTLDSCEFPGSCKAHCSHTKITQCISGDGCCPAGCGQRDKDCKLNSMHVGDIVMDGRKFWKHCRVKATVPVLDTNGKGVSGADVYVHWSGAYSMDDNRKTDRSGKATFYTRLVRCDTFTITVKEVKKSGWTYDPNANLETSESIVP